MSTLKTINLKHPDGTANTIQMNTSSDLIINGAGSGNVGIGTATPSYTLETSRSTNNTIASRSDGTAYVSVAGNNTIPLTSSFDIIQDSTNAYVWQRANAPVLFATNNTERMQISASGNVGIGLGGSSPITSLQVSGTSTLSNPNGTSYNENLRLPPANSGFVSIGMGTNPSLEDGVHSDQWTLVRYPTNHATTPSAFGIRVGSGSAGTDDVIYARKDGAVAFPKMPFVYAYVTSGQTSTDITGGQNAILNYEGVIVDVTNSWNTTTSTFTAPIPGVYIIEPKMWFGANTYGTIYCELVVNGSIVGETRMTRSSSIAEYNTFQPRFIIELSTNDYFSLKGTAGSNATLHRSSSLRYTHLIIQMQTCT